LIDSALPIVAARLGDRCDELITAHERRANSAARLGRNDEAIANFESALACTDDPKTRAQLEVQLQRLH
jgi:predicted RNA polymerase sigma factor